MGNIFGSIPVKVPSKHLFKGLSHNLKLTLNMGDLVPVFVSDVLPTDRMRISANQLIRFAPLLAPIMSEVDVYMHFFFVPNRLIWKHWETFITGSDNGHLVSSDNLPVKPYLYFSSSVIKDIIGRSRPDNILGASSLIDYLGFQPVLSLPSSSSYKRIDVFPVVAYNKIYYDWYMDENLQTGLDTYLDMATGVTGLNNVVSSSMADSNYWYNMLRVRKRNWKKDYFTSALPWAQKGAEVQMPISVNNISPKASLTTLSQSSNQVFGTTGSAGDLYIDNSGYIRSGSLTGEFIRINTKVSTNNIANSLQVSADIGTIRDLRRAYAAQAFLERRAVGGTRYGEQNFAFFGQRQQDSRLQRSEYLGGYKVPVVVSQVLQTSESSDNSPQGNPSGNAVSAGGSFIFDRSFPEHGFVIGIMSVMPKADYADGTPRMYLRKDVYDYYWPQFAHIGEQPIFNEELYDSLDDTSNGGTFGYTPRYSEYRFKNNRLCGDFRDSLKFWTLSRFFSSTPSLNSSFIECSPSTRIFAVEDASYSDHLWAEVSFNVSALRPIPKYAESL